MAEEAAANDKETRRKHQLNKMSKIVAKAWRYPKAEPFQESSLRSSDGAVFDLASVGQNIDNGVYKPSKHGWEHFAKDLGGVYNYHIIRKTNHQKYAKAHRDHLEAHFTKIDAKQGTSFVKALLEHCPKEPEKKSKKRKSTNSTKQPKKKVAKTGEPSKTLADMSQAEREEYAMESLRNYIQEVGGSLDQVAGFHSKVMSKSDGRFESNYFNSDGKRFRSMIEVARSYGLVQDKLPAPKKKKIGNKKPSNNRDCENEKKRLRRELDKVVKAHRKASKALDDFQNEKKEGRYPIDDDLLMEDDKAAKSTNGPLITPTACPAALIPDLDGFPGFPAHCTPDLLMTWDFLCTFNRALSLNPIDLDDFVSALAYTPATSNGTFDQAAHVPPVYLAEAHLGLLKLLLQDRSSDDWWWSVLETDETEGILVDEAADVVTCTVDVKIPLIKVDMAALLSYEEDPLITSSWLQSLEEVRNHSSNNRAAIKRAIKTARGVVANKWVKAYLKKALKGDTPSFTKRAALWLVDRMKEARPDLWGQSTSKDDMLKQQKKVVEEVTALMEKMHDAESFVSFDDIESGESDNDSDDSDEEEDDAEAEASNPAPSTPRATNDDKLAPVISSIPPKPLPALVDLLLPPSKPLASSDIVSPFTWPALTGATASRILHRYKRLRNEVDDSLRAFNELPPMTREERRQREEKVAARVLTECAAGDVVESPIEKAAAHLSSGGNYLELNPVERLCLLRVLIDGAYDSGRVHEIVDGNFKARIEAVKQLEMEKRRARKKAREEEAAAQKAAREKLAAEARMKFMEDKRNEIEETNLETREYTDEFIESLTEDDIIDFDEESKAQFEALPGPESFNRTEVNKMVARMQEEAAFNTDSLTVLTMDEILSREKQALQEMEERLASFGDLDTLGMDRDSRKAVDRLKRNIQEAKDAELSLPELRAQAEEALKDAMQDGTMKALRAAIRLAKQAELCGDEELTGGMWAHDLLRDAALELKAAEGRKRVVEAQKDLVAKRNKCFIRTVPMGRDRFRNRFWQFDNSESGHVWAEVDYVINDESNGDQIMSDSKTRYVHLLTDSSAIGVGAGEKEEDFVKPNQSPEETSAFVRFSRQEFHKSGKVSCLAKRHWGCQTTELSWRDLIKNLDDRGTRERELKENLKEALEESRLSGAADASKPEDSTKVEDEKSKGKGADYQKSGDEHVFLAAKQLDTSGSQIISPDLLQGISSALGLKVRLREVVDSTKDEETARYDLAVIDGWKLTEVEETEEMETNGDGDDSKMSKVSMTPVWRASLERGGEQWLPGYELLEGLCRYIRWNRKDPGYFEDDASFLAYRNSLGRHSGKASEAALASTPMMLARLMLKREQELYMPLKNRSYDNNWGGKCGARNAWITTMKDYCFDLQTAKDALLTLEEALFELTGGIPEQQSDPQVDAKALLNDEATLVDIELESIDKSVNALWNSRQSRAIFREIVQSSTTTGFLALALDLLYRNCRAYLDINKLSEPRQSFAAPTPIMTRRMNAWQKANASLYG